MRLKGLCLGVRSTDETAANTPGLGLPHSGCGGRHGRCARCAGADAVLPLRRCAQSGPAFVGNRRGCPVVAGLPGGALERRSGTARAGCFCILWPCWRSRLSFRPCFRLSRTSRLREQTGAGWDSSPSSGLLGFATVCLGWFLAGPERIRIPLRAITGAGLLVSCYGTAQYFGVDPFLPTDAYHVGGEGWGIVRPPGTLGHAGYFATYLLYVVFFGTALAQLEGSLFWAAFGRCNGLAGDRDRPVDRYPLGASSG